MFNIKIAALPFNKVTKVNKCQAEALKMMAEAQSGMLNTYTKIFGITGTLVLLHLIISTIKEYGNNNHEERMAELEIEKIKILKDKEANDNA